MSLTHSARYHVFATDSKGGAHSIAATHDIEEAREAFREFRANSDIIRIRVARDDYALGGGDRARVWLCDWKRKPCARK